MGGDAVEAILFGDVSPSGREVTTWYPAAYQEQRRVTDMQLAPHTTLDGKSVPGVTYLYYSGPTLWPFGWGLSYTTFAYAWFDEATKHQRIDAAAWACGSVAPPTYSVNVTNTGRVTSDIVVLAYFSTELPGEPITELFDFQRAANLAPGSSITLRFSLPASVAATVDEAGTHALTPGRFSVHIGDVHPSSSLESNVERTTYPCSGCSHPESGRTCDACSCFVRGSVTVEGTSAVTLLS
jgi:hypothetical protein